jgi:NitT/TauT family transport system substrate-binding protein
MLRMKGLCAALVGLALAGAATTAQAETNKIRIGLQFGLSYLPIMIAQSERMIEKHAKALGLPDVEVILQRLSGTTAVNDALLSNSIDFGALGMPGVLIAWEKTKGRQHVKGIAGLATITYFVYVNKPNLKSLADFTDQDKIAVPAFNSPQAILLRAAAEKQLGSAAKANALMVSMPHPDATGALLSGSGISGYFSTPPFTQVLAKDSRVRPILTSTEIKGKDSTAAAVTVTEGFVEDNPKVTQAVLDGLDEATQLIRTNPKRAAEIYLQAESVKLSQQEVETILKDGSTTYDVAPQGVLDYAQMMQQQGFMKAVPTSWDEVFLPLLKGRNGS